MRTWGLATFRAPVYCINVLIHRYNTGEPVEERDVETSQLTAAGSVLLGVSAAIAAAAFLLAVMPPSERRIERWSSRHGLALTHANQAVVAGYLRRTRALQVAGAALGWLASPVYIDLVGRPFPLGDSWVVLAIAGSLLGSIVAEVTHLRRSPSPATIRAATLAPRTLFSYVPPATLWAIRALPGVTVVLAVLYVVAPKDPGRTVDPSVALVGVAALLMVVFALLLEWFLKAIVARPQPAITDDLLAADDSLRAASIHSLAAAGLALMLLSIGWALVALGDVSASAVLDEILPWVGAACDVGAVLVWIVLGHIAHWRVRRDVPVVSG